MGYTDFPEHQPNNEIDLAPAPPYEQALGQHSPPSTNNPLSRLPKLFSSTIDPSAQPAYTALSQNDPSIIDIESQTQEAATRDASTNATDGQAHAMAPLAGGQPHVHCEQCTEFALQKEKMKHRQDLLAVFAASLFILAWVGMVFGSLAWRRKSAP